MVTNHGAYYYYVVGHHLLHVVMDSSLHYVHRLITIPKAEPARLALQMLDARQVPDCTFPKAHYVSFLLPF